MTIATQMSPAGKTFARWSSSPLGADLVVGDGGMTVSTGTALVTPRLARSTIAHDSGSHGAEFFFWGDDPVVATIGVVMPTAPLSAEVGYSGGAGWRLHAGEVVANGVVLVSGLPIPIKGATVGIAVDIGSPSRARFFLDGEQVADLMVPVAGAIHFAVSLASTKAGGISCAANAGQWQALSAAAHAGWFIEDEQVEPMRLASEDYMTLATDAPASAAFMGLLASDGLSTVASVSFWPWENASRSGSAQVRVMDSQGLLDAAAIGALRGQPVAVRQVLQGQPLSTSVAVARFVLDRIDIEDDGRKLLTFRDAHNDLDSPLGRSVFLPPQGEGIAWQTMPAVIGAVRSAPCIAVNRDGSQQWLCDFPIGSVESVMDRGAKLEAGTAYTLGPRGQHLVLSSPPVGPVFADVSSQPDMAPATLRQALTEVFSRIGKASWSADDAQAIDQISGYGGVGFYGGDGATVRDALSGILTAYTADWWQDDDGVLRLARLIDPESIADADLRFDLDWNVFAGDLIVLPDLAPNLSRRLAYQPNGVILGAGDLITDLEQLPPERRQQLTSVCRGQAYSGGMLAARYAHADSAAPMVSRLDRKEDAQAEIERVVALYEVPRNFYAVRINARPDLRLRPGQVGRITYPRYGLQAGRKVLVSGVTSNPVTGDHVLKLWGA
ncbi:MULTISPECIES: hypothetical protein [Stenotrophomonas]|uniref:B30.2/SPRY domain-containing protein n=1 Tax=Stenotrophomonas lactitubi TaxID=2045214 RepID=A0AAW4GJC8_9GAMM|nr:MULTISPECIES: hypothetical protein [Stenotrophomonas]MBM9913971.1 hypothetical protein [Stenotrophomonas lactitubi]MBM9921964.1 hypothetical protein [Stenotrophomonas lactitubi]MBM9936529.1 hypothetical protein [Stenotrophomonas lactitubi]